MQLLAGQIGPVATHQDEATVCCRAVLGNFRRPTNSRVIAVRPLRTPSETQIRPGITIRAQTTLSLQALEPS